MNPKVMVLVDREYLNTLEKDSHFLECLDACGVHMWDGIEEALMMLAEESGDDY